ncbi:MAG: EVE domain-containing protein [Alphaproteobacteria bacterium]|nr:EVE domain-containing protein [Alphaproteobacteria bacterium]
MTKAPAKKKSARKNSAAKTAAKKAPPARKPTSATPERKGDEPLYWLFKSEPDKWSWEMQKARGAKGEQWDGVRNYQARNNMQAMRVGDLGFFYHSNEGKEIVGIVRVCREAHQDTTTDDERWQCVDIEAVQDVARPVTLADVKDNPKLSEMSLVTSMRLSVQPVTRQEWAIVCRMAGLDPNSVGQP